VPRYAVNRTLLTDAPLCVQRVCTFETIKFRSNGELANNICQVAEEDRASTVIAGSRGLGLYDRVMLGTTNHQLRLFGLKSVSSAHPTSHSAGSVSTALLNRCRCSVLIARDSS
jgi:nucleotide-binding universal stress UspA family protein